MSLYLFNCFSARHCMSFKAITFRETTSAVSIALNHCVDQISQKEEKFKIKLNKEIERRKKLEEELKYV